MSSDCSSLKVNIDNLASKVGCQIPIEDSDVLCFVGDSSESGGLQHSSAEGFGTEVPLTFFVGLLPLYCTTQVVGRKFSPYGPTQLVQG